jgi:hypothetical protein
MPRGLELGGGPDGRAPPVSGCRQKEKEGVRDGPAGEVLAGLRGSAHVRARSGKRKAGGLDGLRPRKKREGERATWA